VPPRVTQHGSKLVGWAAVEAVQRSTTTKIAADRDRLAERRGKNIAKVAAARALPTLIYYGLRADHIRALDRRSCNQIEGRRVTGSLCS
jgi:hypothetical protein